MKIYELFMETFVDAVLGLVYTSVHGQVTKVHVKLNVIEFNNISPVQCTSTCLVLIIVLHLDDSRFTVRLNNYIGNVTLKHFITTEEEGSNHLVKFPSTQSSPGALGDLQHPHPSNTHPRMSE